MPIVRRPDPGVNCFEWDLICRAIYVMKKYGIKLETLNKMNE